MPRTIEKFDGHAYVRRSIGAEIIAALMWGQKTIAEITEIVGADKHSVTGWLESYRDSGVVVVVGERKTATKPAKVFAITLTPFGEPRP